MSISSSQLLVLISWLITCALCLWIGALGRGFVFKMTLPIRRSASLQLRVWLRAVTVNLCKALWFPGGLTVERASQETSLGLDKEKKVPFFSLCVSFCEAILAGGFFGECSAFNKRFGTCWLINCHILDETLLPPRILISSHLDWVCQPQKPVWEGSLSLGMSYKGDSGFHWMLQVLLWVPKAGSCLVNAEGPKI